VGRRIGAVEEGAEGVGGSGGGDGGGRAGEAAQRVGREGVGAEVDGHGEATEQQGVCLVVSPARAGRWPTGLEWKLQEATCVSVMWGQSLATEGCT
jgi:hypothetical protein